MVCQKPLNHTVDRGAPCRTGPSARVPWSDCKIRRCISDIIGGSDGLIMMG